MRTLSPSAPAGILQRPIPALPVALLLAGLIVAVALYWLGQTIALENYRKLLIGIVALQVVAIVVWWRASVYLFSAFILVEGFLINYFHNNPELNLMKDALVITLFGALALRLVTRGIFPFPVTRWMLPFFAFAAVYLAQVFNPYLPNLLVGLAGVRVTLLYFLLVPIAFWFFSSRETVLRFFSVQLALSAPVGLFGIYQYYAGPEWMVSLSPGFARAVFYAYGARASADTTYFRTFSTFVQTGGFSQYLMAMMLLCVAAWLAPAFRRYRIWLAGIFVLHFLALLTTGGRGPFLMFFAAAGLLLLLFRGAGRTAPLLILAPLLLWVSVSVVGSGFLERFETLLDIDEVQGRTSALGYGWLTRAMNEDWAGLGAGYASIASRHVGTTPLNGIVVENTLAKIRFEAGLPGFLLFLVFVLVMMWEALRVPGRVHDRDLRWFASCGGVYVFVILLTTVTGTPLDTAPSNTYLWLFAGFLARVQMISAAATPAANALPRGGSAS
jgi:hypothetical protein